MESLLVYRVETERISTILYSGISSIRVLVDADPDGLGNKFSTVFGPRNSDGLGTKFSTGFWSMQIRMG